MNKKIIFFGSILLIISFSSGIFTEIVASSEALKIATQLPSVGSTIMDYLKSDIITILAIVIFSASVFLVPLVPMIIMGKCFSLGFSAAYILSSTEEGMLSILFAALLPRGIFKIPTYIALVVLSFEMAIFIKDNYQKPASIKRSLPRHLLHFVLCFFLLAVSSILEAFLLQSVL